MCSHFASGALGPSADLNESSQAPFMEVQNKTTRHPILKSKTTSHTSVTAVAASVSCFLLINGRKPSLRELCTWTPAASGCEDTGRGSSSLSLAWVEAMALVP